MNPAVLSGQTSWVITFLASFLIWIMFATFLFLSLIDKKIKKEAVFQALISTFVAWVITQFVKSLFPIPRPFEVLGIFPMTITLPQDPTFPSGHAASAFAMASSVAFHDKKIGLTFLLLAFMVSVGRVLGHVHYARDAAVGAGIGILTSYFVGRINLRKLLR